MDNIIEALKSRFQGKIEHLRIFKQRFKLLFVPRLGTLYHYPPRPHHIPANYNKISNLEVTPIISIVTPSFNSIAFIEQTIKSVLEQSYPKLEYVIQDGDSDDGTVEIVKKYSANLAHWQSRRDKGQSHAINLGFRNTSGEIMAYLNSDDTFLPGTLHYVAQYFSKHPEVDVVYGHRVLINEEGSEIGRWILPPHCNYTILWHDFIPQETLFWRRRIWDKVGGYVDESFQFAMDWDLTMRFRDAGARFVRLPRFLGAFRVHSRMKSIDKVDMVGVKEMNVLRKRWHDPEISDQQLEKFIRRYLRYHVLLNNMYRLKLLRY
jgi:glycosyltransferase involved in cell wall biosynthesis